MKAVAEIAYHAWKEAIKSGKVQRGMEEAFKLLKRLATKT